MTDRAERVAVEIAAAKDRSRTRGDLFALLSYAVGEMSSEGIEQAITLATVFARLDAEGRAAALRYARSLLEWQDG